MPTIIERLHQLGVGRRTLGVELEGWAETYGEDLVRLVECEATRGSITQRGRGSWQVAFRTGGGDRVRETVRGTRTDAERRLTELLREYDMTGLVPDREATVSMFAEQWLEHVAHRIKPITLKRYRELLTVHVVPVIGSIHMTELRPAGVQAVVTKVLEHRSPRMAVNTYRVLSEMLGEASGGESWRPTPLSPSDHRGSSRRSPHPGRDDVYGNSGACTRAVRRRGLDAGARHRDAARRDHGRPVA